jgi:hypothetical protein
MKFRTSLLAASLLAVAAWPALACYTVYDSSSRVVFRSAEPPVDMSRPLHETVPQRFPGGQLVFDTGTSCPGVSGGRLPLVAANPAPLLTDRQTAQALGVRYSPLSNGVVVVAPREAAVVEAALGSQLTVVPSEPLLAAADQRSPTSVMGGPPSGQPMITELRDPPVRSSSRRRAR